MDDITVTLVLYVNEDDEETISQSVDVAKVGDEVSIVLHKSYKDDPSGFVRMRLSKEDTRRVIAGLREALKDNPKDFLKEY